MKNKTSRKRGFTLVEIMIVVAIIGLLAAIAIPNFVKARQTAYKSACINNLRQIDSAIQEWALEGKKADDAPVAFTDIKAYLKNDVTCPAGGKTFADSYSIVDAKTSPVCLFKGEAKESVPEKQHALPKATEN